MNCFGLINSLIPYRSQVNLTWIHVELMFGWGLLIQEAIVDESKCHPGYIQIPRKFAAGYIAIDYVRNGQLQRLPLVV
jgi:hypothetical protein